MGSPARCQGKALAAIALAALLLVATVPTAEAQFFLAARPAPELAIGPLLVRTTVTPALAEPTVDVLFGLAIPPDRSALDFEQDLLFLWPGAVAGTPTPGASDPALAREIEARGFTITSTGRLTLLAHPVYATDDDAQAQAVAGGAPYATFVDAATTLGLSAPATLVRIPWNPYLVNRTWLLDLRFTAPGVVKPTPATWVSRTFWGPRHRLTLGFNDIRPRAVFPMYLWNRERIIPLSEDPAQIVVNFAEAGRLRIDEVFPQASSRRLSESLERTEVVSVFLERSERITPQVLTVRFGYFSGIQSWAPVLIPVLFFVLGRACGPLIERVVRAGMRSFAARIAFGRARAEDPRRVRGVIVPREVLERVVPGTTRHEDVLRLCGAEPEEHEQLGAPDRRTLVYRGYRAVPQPRRRFGWLATVRHWDVEHHEVTIEVERGIVRDVQARVRRSHAAGPDAA